MQEVTRIGPMPALGLGVYRCPAGTATYDAVTSALKLGYRHIDTAAYYGNEADVGRAVRDSGIPREDIFVTTKVWTLGKAVPKGNGFQDAVDSVDDSLRKLDIGYIDLILLHSPHHERLDRYRGLEKCLEDGKVKYIGVSNYGIKHLKELLAVCQVKPLVNQIEAYSPLAKAKTMKHPVLLEVSKNYNKTVAQVMLRFLLQRGFVILPKSEKPKRQAENANVFDFTISDDDMQKLWALDAGMTTGWDPTTIE